MESIRHIHNFLHCDDTIECQWKSSLLFPVVYVGRCIEATRGCAQDLILLALCSGNHMMLWGNMYWTGLGVYKALCSQGSFLRGSDDHMWYRRLALGSAMCKQAPYCHSGSQKSILFGSKVSCNILRYDGLDICNFLEIVQQKYLSPLKSGGNPPFKIRRKGKGKGKAAVHSQQDECAADKKTDASPTSPQLQPCLRRLPLVCTLSKNS